MFTHELQPSAGQALFSMKVGFRPTASGRFANPVLDYPSAGNRQNLSSCKTVCVAGVSKRYRHPSCSKEMSPGPAVSPCGAGMSLPLAGLSLSPLK